MPREGMLVQVDGSHHRWLGDHGPPFALLPAVDDATGIVANALFCEQENTRDYFLLMRGLIQRYGIPIALYTDRHSVFKNVPGAGRRCTHTVQSCHGRARRVPFACGVRRLKVPMVIEGDTPKGNGTPLSVAQD